MSNQKIVSASESKKLTPWNPYQVLGLMFVATVIVAGILLGINWKRLRKPEWQVKTILFSIIVPVIGITLAMAWLIIFADHQIAPVQLVLSVPYLAFGANLGYMLALARLQNGAYKVYETQGLEALSNYEYDLKGAVLFGTSVALITGIGFTLIAPFLIGG